MKVNMTPNPLDVVTIHASQGDSEARQWEFELHNNGELIDTSDVTEQMFFKAYKGGTEQLLPENTSTPTTSPFLGDIRYPQGLLADQEFTYRESPTEEDGLAKITDIKGNTLNWNQLVQNGNIADTTGWYVTGNSGTISASNNILSFVVSDSVQSAGINRGDMIQVVQGHKYFVSFENKCSESTDNVMLRLYASGNDNRTSFFSANSTWSKVNTIITARASGNVRLYIYPKFNATSPISVGAVYDIKNVMVIDLTAMGLDSLTDAEIIQWFADYFPLPFYAYNQGSLLSFMGNGIKTVGKNQIKLSADNLVSSQRIGINYSDNGAVFTANGTYSRAGYTYKTIKGQQYTLSFKGFSDGNFGAVYISNDLDWSTNYGRIILGSTETNRSLTFTADSELLFVGFYLTNTGTSGSMTIKDIQLELGSSVTSFEPYTSSTLSLPISTYFPNGMKSAGNVYDELTESKAITRIGSVDLGTLSFYYNSSLSYFYATIPNLVNGMTYATESPNVIVQNYEYKGGGVGWANMPNMSYGFNGQDIRIKNTAYTSSAEFVNAVSGTYVVYELATYEETSFTTASLVTENAEIPLSAENDVLVGKCTEELSSQPGFIDAKIRLLDGDGDCYSNKIQLHVERKP